MAISASVASTYVVQAKSIERQKQRNSFVSRAMSVGLTNTQVTK